MVFSSSRERLGNQLWLIPAVLVAAALGAAALFAVLDEHVQQVSWLRFPGGTDSARSLLSSIAGAMITFTGLVFSITILVLQLASQQYSPRVLRTFLRDRQSQLALGLFTATFVYALVVLRQITQSSIPSLSVTFSVVLVISSVGVFVAYISHMANAIRVSTIIDRVAWETRRTIDARYDRVEEPVALPAGAIDDEEARRWRLMASEEVVSAETRGMLIAIDVDGAVSLARDLDVTFVAVPAIGDFVPEGSPVLGVVGGVIDPDRRDDAGELFALARDRTVEQDVPFGFRQLVDVAERALSPSLNDPTTAVQTLDQIHDLLRRMVVRRFPPQTHRDEDGVVRLVLHGSSWDQLVTLAVSEIRTFGARSIQVLRRLRGLLLDLLEVAPPSRRDPIERELAVLSRTAARLGDERDIELARGSDLQGLGS